MGGAGPGAPPVRRLGERIKAESARALVWTSGLLVVLASIILSPTGAFALLALAAGCAAVASVLASQWPRVISLVLLIASLALAARSYPAVERERDAYVERAKRRGGTPPSATPAEP